MSKIKIVLATGNKGKYREIKAIFKNVNVEILPLSDFDNIPEVVEDGKTYHDNARKKAEVISETLNTWVISDDSGLEVDALDGAPGIFSARFAGPEQDDKQNIERLLEVLEEIPKKERGARFRCVAALARPNEETLFAEGLFEGMITKKVIGENGFGYDPVFMIPELKKTAAEISIEEKNKLSHRSKAFKEMAKIVKNLLK